MSDEESTVPEEGAGPTTASDDDSHGGSEVEYVRRSFYLPRVLVEGLEERAREAGSDSSEILAKALAEHLGREPWPPYAAAAGPGSPGPATASPGPGKADEPGAREESPAGDTPYGAGTLGAGAGTDELAEADEHGKPAEPGEPGPPGKPGADEPDTPGKRRGPGTHEPGASPGPGEASERAGVREAPDFSGETLSEEAHDLAESLYSRLSLLGTLSLDAPPVRETLEQVSRVIEARDAFTEGHARGVAALARGVAGTLDLEADEVLAIELAGLAHELGKLAVPRSILGKRGKLTASERETLRRYPKVAARLLRSVPALQPLERLVMHHQERWDGSGYPAGLAGDEIPLGAQIVGIADAYHALTSARAYRPALDSGQARNIVREASGRLWNPKVAQALIRHVGSRE